MIEYALLFGLGFLSAALLAALTAPAIHRRIVLFTENRLKATMPLSPQEIRAQRDLSRAAFAAENARTLQLLVKEREKSLSLQLHGETLAGEATRLHGENHEMAVAIGEMEVEAGELRSQTRRAELEAEQLRETLKRIDESIAARDLEIESQRRLLQRRANEIDTLSMEAAAAETEIENLRQRVQVLRDERDETRQEGKLSIRRAREAEQRLAQEEHTRIRLDDRLIREMAANADKDSTIERRSTEIAQLQQKLKESRAANRAAAKALKAANVVVPKAVAAEVALPLEEVSPPAPAVTGTSAIDAERLGEELRNRQTALVDLLKKPGRGAGDEALREELADIAARMLVLTAAREGRGSPVREIVSKAGTKGAGKRPTLAERARAMEPSLFRQPD